MNKKINGCAMLLSLTIFLFGCDSQNSSKEPGKTIPAGSTAETVTTAACTIEATIKNLPDGCFATLRYDSAGDEKTRRRLPTSGPLNFDVEAPYPCTASVEIRKADGGVSSFELVLEKGKIFLSGDMAGFRPAVVTGTSSNNELNTFYNEPDVQQLVNQLDDLEAAQSKLETAKANNKALEAAAMQCFAKMDELAKRSYKYIKEHPNTYASVFLVEQYMALNATPEDVVWATCKNIDKALLVHSKAGMKINSRLEELKAGGKFK